MAADAIQKTQFASDNTAGMCPEAMDAFLRANRDSLPSYVGHRHIFYCFSAICVSGAGKLSAITAQLVAAAEIHPSRPCGKPLFIVG
jgi:hypothetical protein